jgi:type IV pilus assembly protein PilN
MIRTNLSTRPFYNERTVRTILLIVAVAVVAFTAFNASRVLRYSRSDTRLQTQAARDEARAADLRQQASRLRATVDTKQIDSASLDAREANDLIDRRTFSWTDLFNRFESTLPDDARITIVRPKLEEEGFTVEIHVIARTVEDVNRFMENLEGTGAFRSTVPVEERPEEQLQTVGNAGGPPQLNATITTTYLPDVGHPAGPASRRQTRGARR